MELFLGSILCNLIYSRKKYLDHASYLRFEHHPDVRRDWKQLVEEVARETPHQYAFSEFFDYHGHAQTSLAFTLKNCIRVVKNIFSLSTATVYEREILRLTDGGTIALDWVRDPDDQNFTKHSNKPIVFMVHGLVGDSQSEYIYHFAREMLDAGYQPVVFVARGCGGLTLTSPTLFSAKIPIDVVEAIHHIEVHYDHSSDHHQRKIFAVGYSLGAASMMHYLSLCRGFNSRVTAAVCVSPPWSFTNAAFSPGFVTSIWLMLLMIPVRLHYLLHHNTLVELSPEDFEKVTIWKIFSAYLFARYDETLISVYHKLDRSWIYETSCKKMAARQPTAYTESRYASVLEYYESITPVNFAHEIPLPTLVISSEDDPICRHEWSVAIEQMSTEMVVVSLHTYIHIYMIINYTYKYYIDI